MTFDSIIGYNSLKEKLRSIINSGRIPHALLFAGSDGTPKLSFAIAFAQSLNCQNHVNGFACGQCASCNKFNKLIHPDLHFIYPVVKTKKIKNPVSADFIDLWREFVMQSNYHSFSDWIEKLNSPNLQPTIYSQESQEILRIVNLKSFEAKFKVIIIYMPEKMHIVTANKLLKVIEEPPLNTLFILVSENEENILTTIRSRTQLIKVPKFSYEDLVLALKNEFQDIENQEIIEDAAKISDGNFAFAKKIIYEYLNEGQTSLSAFFDLFVKFMRLAFAFKFADIVNFVEELSSMTKEEQKAFLDYSLNQIRQNFVYNIMPEGSLIYMTKKEKSFAEKFKRFISQKNITKFEQEFSKAIFDLERNGNPKLIFLDLLLKTGFLLKNF